MQIGLIGLGRMGGNIARRLMQHGHEAVVYDRDARVVAALTQEGAAHAGDLAELVGKLRAPRAIWVMLPAGAITESTIRQLGQLLNTGDTIIDAIHSGRTIFAARPRSACTMSMSAQAAASGASSAAIA
jgi:6-phosphogluconate dehydrogenase